MPCILLRLRLCTKPGRQCFLRRFFRPQLSDLLLSSPIVSQMAWLFYCHDPRHSVRKCWYVLRSSSVSLTDIANIPRLRIPPNSLQRPLFANWLQTEYRPLDLRPGLSDRRNISPTQATNTISATAPLTAKALSLYADLRVLRSISHRPARCRRSPLSGCSQWHEQETTRPRRGCHDRRT